MSPGVSRWRWLGLAALLVLLTAAGVEAYLTARAAADLRLVASELRTMAADPSALDIQAAAALVHRARLDAARLQSRADALAPLTARLGWLPKFGPTLAASAPLADFAAGLTAAGDEVLAGLAPVLDPESQAPASDGSLSARVVEALIAAGPGLDAAQTSLRLAEDARARIDPGALLPGLQDNLTEADRLLPLAQEGVSLLRLLPSLLGADSPRTYLLVAQNQDELRATGGFISGIGTVVIDRGRIAGLSIGDSYSVDDLSKAYPSPPEPLRRYMGATQWMVRDANWWPDFPTSAVQIQRLFTFSTGKPTDGVIAFDQTLLTRLLAVTGPAQVPGSSEPIGASNVVQYIQAAWAPSPGQGITPEWWEHRKDFMARLGSAVVDKIQSSSDRAMMLAIARETLALLREKHVLIAVNDARASALLAQAGLDGAIETGAGDFLMLVDTNMGFNKVDGRVERSLAYTVDLRDPAAPRAEVFAHYRHTVAAPIACVQKADYGSAVYEDMQARCYWDYVRVYVAPGSSLVDGSLPPTPGAYLLTGTDEPGIWTPESGENGTSLFSGIFVLPTGRTADLRLTYRLSPRILSERPDGTRAYSLRISKQPGTDAMPVQVTILLPSNALVLDAGGWTTVSLDHLSWQGKLLTDVTLSFVLAP